MSTDRSQWGVQYVARVYVEGDATDEMCNRLTAALNAAAPDADFIGLEIVNVADRPHDQVAT